MKEEKFKVITKHASEIDQTSRPACAMCGGSAPAPTVAASRRRYIANALSGLQPLILQEQHKQIVEDIRKVADEQPEVIEMLIRYWLEKDCT